MFANNLSGEDTYSEYIEKMFQSNKIIHFQSGKTPELIVHQRLYMYSFYLSPGN